MWNCLCRRRTRCPDRVNLSEMGSPSSELLNCEPMSTPQRDVQIGEGPTPSEGAYQRRAPGLVVAALIGLTVVITGSGDVWITIQIVLVMFAVTVAVSLGRNQRKSR